MAGRQAFFFFCPARCTPPVNHASTRRFLVLQGFEDMDETFLRNVSRLGNKFKGTELGGAHTGLAGEDEEEEVRDGPLCCCCSNPEERKHPA